MNNKATENKKHIENIYTEKSIKFLKICISIFIFDLLSYLFAILVYKAFDFGLIFEIISLTFVILALTKVSSKDFTCAKKNIIIAMIPVGWLIIYDFINLLVNIKEVSIEITLYYSSIDSYIYSLAPYLMEITLISIIVLLYKTHTFINIAVGKEKSNTYADRFYDEL
ncbi:MAG: hypothetical protein ACI4UX_00990 [Clostridia bacterium]